MEFSKKFYPIQVTLMNESIEYDEFTLRELRLTNMSEPGQPARTVQHLHYQVSDRS